ncbi:MAG TPA: aminoacyl-histidine dipeptidase [Thermoplasmatales archaeon]|nr:aminoacyl-histidine dipeptidase [Thermoplasmatales archaeon]
MSVLEGLEPKLVWKHFDEIRKIPRCSKHEEKIREYILGFAEKHGFKTKTDKAGNVVVIKPAAQGMEDKPTVVLQAHMDMVCEKNKDVEHDFSKDPIKLKKDGDKLMADGTTLGADDGIGIATILAILEDESLKLGEIEALFTVDEETGLTGAFALEKDMLTGRIMLNLDSEDFGVITVGCAGGGNSEITLPIKKQKIEDKLTHIKVQVSGLRGGHSGVDIHEQRGNAVKILARLLWKASQEYNYFLTDIQGGDKHNAIPREAYACLAIKDTDKDKLVTLLQKEIEVIKEEIKPVDPKLTLTIEDISADGEALDPQSQDSLINLLHALPHGVQKMSYDIPNLVETSTNLASVHLKEDSVVILLSSRSSVMSELHDLRSRIKAMATMVGAKVSEDEPYPGWKPNLDSSILKLSKKVFKDLYGEEPVVEAIHAGLECGIIGEKFPGMDMISIGPTVKHPHSPEEYVEISTVEKFYRYVVEILKNL